MTISGEVKGLKRLRSPGETSAYFKIDDQCVRLFTRRPVIEDGDRVIVAGKIKRGLFVSYAMHNLTKSVTTKRSRMTRLAPYIFGAAFTGGGAVILLDSLIHSHRFFVNVIGGTLLFIGLAFFYFRLSIVRHKSLLKKAAQEIEG